jgi:hypothetical protein
MMGTRKWNGKVKEGKAHVDILKTLQTFRWWPPFPHNCSNSQPTSSSATKRNWLDGFVGVGMGLRLVVGW